MPEPAGGKTILVTGANRGIGLELSRQLGGRGDHAIAVRRKASEARTNLQVETVEGVDLRDRGHGLGW